MASVRCPPSLYELAESSSHGYLSGSWTQLGSGRDVPSSSDRLMGQICLRLGDDLSSRCRFAQVIDLESLLPALSRQGIQIHDAGYCGYRTAQLAGIRLRFHFPMFTGSLSVGQVN